MLFEINVITKANATHFPIFIGMKSIPRNDGNRYTVSSAFFNKILSP